MGSEELLVTEGLTKDFGGLRAVDHVDFTVHRGEIHGIIGPNGAGKTTLFNLITGYLRPTEGKVTFKGRRIDGLPPHRIVYLGIARTFQIVRPFTELSVLENVLVPTLAGSDGASASEMRGRAEMLLERVGLKDRVSHRPGELSGGQRQRVAVARALINEPKLLLADEPTGSLDEETAQSIAELLVELNRDVGVTLIVVTHSQKLAERIGDVMELHGGRLSDRGGV